MTITAAIVLFAVTWFLVFFVVLAWRVETQGDRGHVEPGTPASAPAEEIVWRKAKITTAIAVVLVAAEILVITSGVITRDNLDIFGLMRG